MKTLKSLRSGSDGDAGEPDDTVIVDVDVDVDVDDNAEAGDADAAAGPDSGDTVDAQPTSTRRRPGWKSVLTYAILPALAVLLAAGAGFLKWQNVAAHRDETAGAESVRAATDGTVALLSYKPDTVAKDLDAAKAYMTGPFLDSYSTLTHDVVIPGAQQKKITATATVPAAASVSAGGDHAVVLLFVNQTTTVGQGEPTSSASTVRVTLDRVGNRWLISQFDPV